MAMSIWRCHMVADTSTQRLTEPIYHIDNSENPSKHEDKATRYAFIIHSILVLVSCPKIVQWDTINYNQAAFPHPIETQPRNTLLCISCMASTPPCRYSIIIPFHADLHLHPLYFKMKSVLYKNHFKYNNSE